MRLKIDIIMGEVKSINRVVIDLLVNSDFIPVIAPIGVGKYGDCSTLMLIYRGKVAEVLQAENSTTNVAICRMLPVKC